MEKSVEKFRHSVRNDAHTISLNRGSLVASDQNPPGPCGPILAQDTGIGYDTIIGKIHEMDGHA